MLSATLGPNGHTIQPCGNPLLANTLRTRTTISLGQVAAMGWYIYMHIVILHWYQLVITYRVGYHVRFCDISAQQRGRKYYIFPTWYKNKKVITAFCPKPSTANFMQRNLLLFSRHLPFLLLRAITFHLNFGFTPNPWPFFARFAITWSYLHLWTIIIVDQGLFYCAYV